MSLSRSVGGKRSGDGNLRNITRRVKSYNWHLVTDKTKNIPKPTWSSNAKLKRSGGNTEYFKHTYSDVSCLFL